MYSAVAKPIDWVAIQLARLAVKDGNPPADHVALAAALLEQPEFFGGHVGVPRELEFTGGNFSFTSPVTSPWRANNTVHGRFFPVAKTWTAHPTVVLLHGWNAEGWYWTLFPLLARRLNAAGLNVATFLLPYHAHRKPRGEHREEPTNFLSGDLLHVVRATHQAVTDARALIAWLHEQGCPRVGVWGISLGGWLGGLLACVEPWLNFAVLMTPVARMDRVIAELKFCAPLRRSLAGHPLPLEALNLVAYRPKLAREEILLVASRYDLFAPLATIEELWRDWSKPTLWCVPHGHVSVLLSRQLMGRVTGWITERAR